MADRFMHLDQRCEYDLEDRITGNNLAELIAEVASAPSFTHNAKTDAEVFQSVVRLTFDVYADANQTFAG